MVKINHMTSSIQTIQKYMVGALIACMCAVAFAPNASAATYYTTQQAHSYNSAQIQSLLNQLYTLIAQLQAIQGSSNYTYTYNTGYVPVKTHVTTTHYGNYDVEVETEDYDIESDDTATLFGDIELDNAPYAYAWFEYGEGGNITEESKSVKLTRDGRYSIEIDDLDEDERYYFRAVAEDPSGYRVYGDIMGFGTDRGRDRDDDRNDDDTPEARTGGAENIKDDSARLRGEVRMNDYEDGLVFFVYGEDEDQVEDVEDEDTYKDINEDGDDLRTIVVDRSLDGTRTYWSGVFNLDEDTDHYFRICVQYEDEDNDDTLACGSVEEFQTED